MKTLNFKEAIEKKDVSDFFENVEEMRKAIDVDGDVCKSINLRSYYTNCDYISCRECPFHPNNKDILKSMLPQLAKKETIKDLTEKILTDSIKIAESTKDLRNSVDRLNQMVIEEDARQNPPKNKGLDLLTSYLNDNY